MRIIECRQGEDAWFAARAGVATASQADRLVTPVKRQVSKALKKYAYELAAERMVGVDMDDLCTSWTDRGHELEPEARKAFALVADMDPQECGFILSDDGYTGCSPDGIMPEHRRGLELKCVSPAKHIEYLMSDGVPAEHMGQCQFSLFVTGWPEWSFFSYWPGFAHVHHVVQPDTKWQEACKVAVGELRRHLDATMNTLRELGCVPVSERVYQDPALPSLDEIGEALSEIPT